MKMNRKSLSNIALAVLLSLFNTHAWGLFPHEEGSREAPPPEKTITLVTNPSPFSSLSLQLLHFFTSARIEFHPLAIRFLSQFAIEGTEIHPQSGWAETHPKESGKIGLTSREDIPHYPPSWKIEDAQYYIYLMPQENLTRRLHGLNLIDDPHNVLKNIWQNEGLWIPIGQGKDASDFQCAFNTYLEEYRPADDDVLVKIIMAKPEQCSRTQGHLAFSTEQLSAKNFIPFFYIFDAPENMAEKIVGRQQTTLLTGACFNGFYKRNDRSLAINSVAIKTYPPCAFDALRVAAAANEKVLDYTFSLEKENQNIDQGLVRAKDVSGYRYLQRPTLIQRLALEPWMSLGTVCLLAFSDYLFGPQ